MSSSLLLPHLSCPASQVRGEVGPQIVSGCGRNGLKYLLPLLRSCLGSGPTARIFRQGRSSSGNWTTVALEGEVSAAGTLSQRGNSPWMWPQGSRQWGKPLMRGRPQNDRAAFSSQWLQPPQLSGGSKLWGATCKLSPPSRLLATSHV